MQTFTLYSVPISSSQADSIHTTIFLLFVLQGCVKVERHKKLNMLPLTLILSLND